MNEGVVSALMTGGMPVLAALLILLVAQWFNAKSQAKQVEARRTERRGDNEEWHRRSLFEERLNAAQKAYALVLRLNRAAATCNVSAPDSAGNLALLRMSAEVREWWDENATYLHDGFPKHPCFVGYTNSAGEYANGVQPDLSRYFNEAYDGVRRRTLAMYDLYNLAEHHET